MRISDWSSDVCSSDLVVVAFGTQRRLQAADVIFRAAPEADGGGGRLIRKRHQLRGGAQQVQQARFVETLELGLVSNAAIGGLRSEEHTSELQSLMRISYAVFCLKKKTQAHTLLENITTQ